MEFLNNFQDLYRKNEVNETEVEDLFLLDDDFVFLGTDLNEWAFDKETTVKLVNKQLNKGIDFKFDQATIQTYGAVTFVFTTAIVKEKKNNLDDIKAEIETLLSKEINIERKLEKAGNILSHHLVDLNRSDEVPMRVTLVLKQTDNGVKAHHIQFSFDAVFLWQYRYFKDGDLPSSPLNKNDIPDDLLKVFNKFQEGYDHRDATAIDEYMTIFEEREDIISIGTDADELLIGSEALKEIVLSDWEYWGDFKVNFDRSIIHIHDDMAYFTTDAILRKSHTRKVMLESAEQVLKWNMEEMKDEEDLKSAIKSLSDFTYHMNQGELYIAPMRFSGILRKNTEGWKFVHVQYSDYMQAPEKYLG